MKKDEMLVNESEISIFELFSAIWKKRALIILLSILVTTLLCFCSFFAYFYMKNTAIKEYKITFVLDFFGLDKKTYPNGEKFNPLDIISSNILNEVYSNNNLSEYMTYTNFEKNVSIYQTNDNIQLLNAYYQKIAEGSSNRLRPILLY